MRGWQASAVLGAAAALGCSAPKGDASGPGSPLGPGTGSGSSSVVGGTDGSQVIINTGTDTGTSAQPCNNLLAITLRDFSERPSRFRAGPADDGGRRAPRHGASASGDGSEADLPRRLRLHLRPELRARLRPHQARAAAPLDHEPGLLRPVVPATTRA
jgi:hypothetical protein